MGDIMKNVLIRLSCVIIAFIFVMSNSFAAFSESIKVIDSVSSVSDLEVKYSIINEWENNKNIQVTVTNNEDKEAQLKKVQFVPSWIIGDHQYYCVRNKGEQQEILLIGGYSEEHTYEAPTDDKSTDSLYNKIYKWFPELPYYDNIV